MICTKKNNKKHGLQFWWYDNEQLATEYHFKDTKYNGVCRGWDSDGQIKWTYKYETGFFFR